MIPPALSSQSHANYCKSIYVMLQVFQEIYLRGFPSILKILDLQQRSKAVVLVLPRQSLFVLFFTSHPIRSSFEPSPYHAREIFASFHTCLSSNLLAAIFLFIYGKCMSRRHTVPTALPHSTRSVTQSSVARSGGCEARLQDTSLSNVHLFNIHFKNTSHLWTVEC